MFLVFLPLFILLSARPAQAQLGAILSYKVARFSECNDFVHTCPPISQYCANVVCQQCTDLGQSKINSCCKLATPYLCFQTAYGTVGAGGNPYITSSAVMATDKNYLACETALEVLSICESLSTSFDDLPATRQAPCMCYSSTSWVPQFFDNAFSSCIAYASTADPSDYSDLASGAGFCKSVGNILAPASGSVASTTKSPVTATSGVSGGAILPTTTAAPAAAPSSGSASTLTGTAGKPTSSSGAGMSRPADSALIVLPVLGLLLRNIL